MKVECIPLGDPKEVFLVAADGEEVRRIHTSIFGKTPKIHGSFISLIELNEKLDGLEYAGAKKYVLKALSTSSLHSTELKKRLQERMVANATVQSLLHEFSQLGYLNDLDWVDGFIRRHLRQKFGLRAIAMKLQAKGVSPKEIEAAIAGYQEQQVDKDNIKKLLQTRYSRADLADPKEKHRVVAALARKGFSLESIFDVIGENTCSRMVEK